MTLEDQIAFFIEAGLVKKCPPARAKGTLTRDQSGGRLSYDITPLEVDSIKATARAFKAEAKRRCKEGRAAWKAAHKKSFE